MAAAAAPEASPWEYTIPLSELAEGGRRCIRLSSGRGLILVRDRGMLYAIDAHCYHHGAGLLKGDIEDLGKHRVIVCPWHTYKIDLSTGEGVYVGLDAAALARGAGRDSAKEVRSKGVRQRVHPVVVSDKQIAGIPHDTSVGARGLECSSLYSPAALKLEELKSPYIFVADGAPTEVRKALEIAQSDGDATDTKPGALLTASVGPGASGAWHTERSGAVLGRSGSSSSGTGGGSSSGIAPPSMLHSSLAALGSALGFGGGGAGSAGTTVRSAGRVDSAGALPASGRSRGKTPGTGAGRGAASKGRGRVVVAGGPSSLRGPAADVDASERPDGWLPSDDYATNPFRGGHYYPWHRYGHERVGRAATRGMIGLWWRTGASGMPMLASFEDLSIAKT